nr:extensin-like [Aegilops tauschii subsp. strangulata]
MEEAATTPSKFQPPGPDKPTRPMVWPGGFVPNSQPSPRSLSAAILVSFGRRLLAPPHGAAVRVQPAHDTHGPSVHPKRQPPTRPDHPTPPPPRTHATRLCTATTHVPQRPSGSSPVDPSASRGHGHVSSVDGEGEPKRASFTGPHHSRRFSGAATDLTETEGSVAHLREPPGDARPKPEIPTQDAEGETAAGQVVIASSRERVPVSLPPEPPIKRAPISPPFHTHAHPILLSSTSRSLPDHPPPGRRRGRPDLPAGSKPTSHLVRV